MADGVMAISIRHAGIDFEVPTKERTGDNGATGCAAVPTGRVSPGRRLGRDRRGVPRRLAHEGLQAPLYDPSRRRLLRRRSSGGGGEFPRRGQPAPALQAVHVANRIGRRVRPQWQPRDAGARISAISIISCRTSASGAARTASERAISASRTTIGASSRSTPAYDFVARRSSSISSNSIARCRTTPRMAAEVVRPQPDDPRGIRDPDPSSVCVALRSLLPEARAAIG